MLSSSTCSKRQRDGSLKCTYKCDQVDPRRGWLLGDWFSKPLGVYLMKSNRYHAIYYNVNELNVKEELFLGCYDNAIDAAKAWDNEVRNHSNNYRKLPLNYPLIGETNSRDVLREQLRFFIQFKDKGIFPKPGILEQYQGKWQLDQLSIIMKSSIPNRLNEAEDRGFNSSTLLCYNINPHAYSCKKTRAIYDNGRTKITNLSAKEVLLDEGKGYVNLLRCIRACIERTGVDSYATGALANELIFLKGSWVLNFPSSIAAYIYKTFGSSSVVGSDGTSGGGVVYDSSGGWGGRMLGAMRAGVKKYICCEPCDLTRAGLHKLKFLIWKYQRENKLTQMEIEIHSQGSEKFMCSELVDLSFTSPPYFNLELYSSEVTQSCVAFPTIKDWVTQFLQPTIMNTIKSIKTGGYMILNVSDCIMYTRVNFSLVNEVIGYSLSTKLVEAVPYNGHFPAFLSYQNEVTKEAIVIFRKLA